MKMTQHYYKMNKQGGTLLQDDYKGRNIVTRCFKRTEQYYKINQKAGTLLQDEFKKKLEHCYKMNLKKARKLLQDE